MPGARQSTCDQSLECRRLESVQSPGILLWYSSHKVLHNATAFRGAVTAFRLAFLDASIDLPSRVSTPILRSGNVWGQTAVSSHLVHFEARPQIVRVLPSAPQHIRQEEISPGPLW